MRGSLAVLICCCAFLPIVRTQAADANRANVRPGFGFAGKIEKYQFADQLAADLNRYSLSAWTFDRGKLPTREYYFDPSKCPTNPIPFLFYAPRRTTTAKLPMLIYFGGCGEWGNDLALQFRQRKIFEVVTSADFQKRYPCYLFAPMLPKDAAIAVGAPRRPNNLTDLVSDAMYASIRTLARNNVDTNRLYLTGLSAGGFAAYSMMSAYPGRFAAALPVASISSANTVSKSIPGNYWLIYNETEYKSERSQKTIREFTEKVTDCGGEVRVSTFPNTGHDSWNAAWCEQSVWDWVFSKRAGRPKRFSTSDNIPTSAPSRSPNGSIKMTCSASQPGRDAGTDCGRAVDGFNGTAYVSAGPFGKDDWFMVTFSRPMRGKVLIRSGLDNSMQISSGLVESSINGKIWTRVGAFSGKSGTCSVDVSGSAINLLRIRSTAKNPSVIAICEIEITPR